MYARHVSRDVYGYVRCTATSTGQLAALSKSHLDRRQSEAWEVLLQQQQKLHADTCLSRAAADPFR